MPASYAPRRSGAFTLIELIMVIVIAGIMALVAGRFIAEPVKGYLDLTRRATLVDTASGALERMTREIRLALPNSIRIAAGGRAIEFLRIRTGARYRAEGPGDVLSMTLAGDSFDVIGGLPDAGLVRASPGASLADCASGAVDCLVIYNTGQSGADAYRQDNVAAIRAVATASVTFQRPAPFPFASPRGRFYVVDTPVTYLCDAGATDSVRRYAGYPLSANQGDVDSDSELVAAGAASQLLVDAVSACRFSYQPGSATRGGLVTLELTLSRDAESVSLLQQVHVANLP